MKTIIITLGSMTLAIKAKKLLSKNGINAKLVKPVASQTSNGCSYGIEVGPNDFYSSIVILKSKNMEYSVHKDG